MTNTYYFSHDYNARNDGKIKKLIRIHGYTGYGIYWALVEDLYQNENCIDADYETIAYDLRVEASLIKSIVEEFDLFEVEFGLLSSASIGRRLSIRHDKSYKAKQNAERRWSKQADAMPSHTNTDADAMPSHTEGNALKERKGKERKGNDYSEEYERLWLAYDRKGNKLQGYKEFNKLSPDEKELAYRCITPYFVSQPERKFRKDIERYIAKKHWDSFVQTQANGDIKVTSNYTLPSLSNNFVFSLWEDIKELSGPSLTQYYQHHDKQIRELYAHTRQYKDLEWTRFEMLPNDAPIKQFILSYMQYRQTNH